MNKAYIDRKQKEERRREGGGRKAVHSAFPLQSNAIWLQST